MFLTEYDEERHMELEREEWEAKGIAKSAKALVETCQEFGLSREAVGERLCEKLSVSADVAEEYLAAYWKENVKAGTDEGEDGRRRRFVCGLHFSGNHGIFCL